MKIIIAILCIVIAVPLYCGASELQDMLEQGDEYFKKAEFSEALMIYEEAIALDPGSQEAAVRIEKTAVAKNADEFLSLLTRKAQKEGDIRITVKDLIEMRVQGADITMIDVRTGQEHAITTAANSLNIQLYELMKNLDKIPPDGTVVIICHSGSRSLIAAAALRMIGYNNVYSLKGGIVALADVNAKKAPDELVE